jgi:hypothetical protein
MHFLVRAAPVSFLLHALILLHIHELLAFQTSCAKEYASSSLAVMTAGVISSFTITATDYPGPPCNLGSEMFGFNVRSMITGGSPLAARFSSQWSVTPPNQFNLPLVINSSGAYSAEVVRFGNCLTCTFFYPRYDVFAGSGLDATYYENLHLGHPAAVSRVDPAIDFDWRDGPITPNASDFVSVRWTGKIRSSWSLVHTFFALADEGARLWIDDELIIDRWSSSPNM